MLSQTLRAVVAVLLACHVTASTGRLLKSAAAVREEPSPYWYPQFTVTFNETTRLLFSRTTTGTWYYDSGAGLELVVRDNGRGDRYCGTIHPFSDTPCWHLVTGGQRYLVFPELRQCCRCCDAAHGCGVLSPSWLQGAEFLGNTTVQGRLAYKWSQPGLQSNFYYTTADVAQLPLELDQLPNDFTELHAESFSPLAPDRAVFALPPFPCQPSCPLTSTCTLLAT